LAEDEFSTQEIMSITGQDSLQEVERYTRAASQKRPAARVKARYDGQNGAKTAKPSIKVWQKEEKTK